MQTKKPYHDEATITHLLNTVKTIAVVGLSSDPGRAGYYVPAYLQQHGYRIIPVNPTLQQALGEEAYPDLASVPGPVDLVLIFRRSEAVTPFAKDAAKIGAKAVWMQLGIYNEEAARIAEKSGLKVVMDTCMMVEHRQHQRPSLSASPQH